MARQFTCDGGFCGQTLQMSRLHCLGSLSNMVKCGCATCFGEHKLRAKKCCLGYFCRILFKSIRKLQFSCRCCFVCFKDKPPQHRVTRRSDNRTFKVAHEKHDIDNLPSDTNTAEFFLSGEAACFSLFSLFVVSLNRGFSVGVPLACSWI